MLVETEIISMYKNEDKSTYEIAEYYNTYPNKIRRILKKHGCELKNRSEAQKSAIEKGRTSHPTAGKKRTHEEKVKISSGLVNYWDDLNKEERQRRTNMAKIRWAEMPDEQKEKISKAAIEGIRKAGKEGSKFEKILLKRITNAGYRVDFHKKNLIPNEKLEIDLYIPEIKTIIEIDGPSHFLPVWGEEKLQKQINADLQKNGLILGMGFVIIRLIVLTSLSLKKEEDAIQIVINKLNEIKAAFPSKEERYIEVNL